MLPGGTPHGMVETQQTELEEIPMPRLCSARIANARAVRAAVTNEKQVIIKAGATDPL